MATPPDLVINSLRGGQNDSDPSISIPADQGIYMRNVEFNFSMLGDRRLGGDNISLSGAGATALAASDRVTWLHRHLPTSDETAAQLWAFGVTGTSSSALAYKTTSWTAVTPTDAFTLTGGYQYQHSTVSLHGKLFWAHKSGQDRLHVWDGTTFRRVGLAPPAAAPTAANSGGAGTLSGTRYYRVRYTVQSGGVTLRRSEPSSVLTHSPSGTNASITVTKPATISEGETHWELEASIDNANFFRIATTVVGTTTYVDSTPYSNGYGIAGVTSEDIGDYTVPISVKFLAADEDRLLMGGSFESDAYASRVSWTPVYNDPGDGNDERVPDDTDNYLDLDGFEGGALTALHGPINGNSWAFKNHHIYKLIRTGKRTRAYDAFCVTKKHGALRGSVVEGKDQDGHPALYFLDPAVGPSRLSPDGLQTCGRDVHATWDTINLDATAVVCFGLYYPDKEQIRWWISTNGSNRPNLMLVLHTAEMINDGGRTLKGFTTWDGTMATALCGCMFSDNIDAGAARSMVLVPFIGMEGNELIWRTETGNTDNGTNYVAHIKTRDYSLVNPSRDFGVMNGTLVAKAASGALLDVYTTMNCGLAQQVVEDVSLTPEASERSVIKSLDDLSWSELNTVSLEFKDPSTPSNVQWQLQQFIYKQTPQQTP